jgi:signal transduction histidine kinase
MFDSDSVYQVARDESDSGLELSLPMTFNDKIWTLQFTNYSRTASIITEHIFGVLILGTLISIMLFILAINLINARHKTLHIQRLNEQLKNLNLSKDRFISVLAHDLKSPFNSLLGFSELLSERITELKKDEIENFARQIHSSAEITYTLLEELLLWARVQTDHFPFNPQKINLLELGSRLIEDHGLMADRKKIIITNEIESNTIVRADELMLKTIIRNLLWNAIKFTNEGGLIRLKAGNLKNKVVVSISDNGIGMTPIEVSDLFDISHIHSKSGTSNEKGTGLGLLLCKDLVKKHGGEIWVESSPGKGSQFSFTLPEA